MPECYCGRYLTKTPRRCSPPCCDRTQSPVAPRRRLRETGPWPAARCRGSRSRPAARWRREAERRPPPGTSKGAGRRGRRSRWLARLLVSESSAGARQCRSIALSGHGPQPIRSVWYRSQAFGRRDAGYGARTENVDPAGRNAFSNRHLDPFHRSASGLIRPVLEAVAPPTAKQSSGRSQNTLRSSVGFVPRGRVSCPDPPRPAVSCSTSGVTGPDPTWSAPTAMCRPGRSCTQLRQAGRSSCAPVPVLSLSATPRAFLSSARLLAGCPASPKLPTAIQPPRRGHEIPASRSSRTMPDRYGTPAWVPAGLAAAGVGPASKIIPFCCGEEPSHPAAHVDADPGCHARLLDSVENPSGGDTGLGTARHRPAVRVPQPPTAQARRCAKPPHAALAVRGPRWSSRTGLPFGAAGTFETRQERPFQCAVASVLPPAEFSAPPPTQMLCPDRA